MPNTTDDNSGSTSEDVGSVTENTSSAGGDSAPAAPTAPSSASTTATGKFAPLLAFAKKNNQTWTRGGNGVASGFKATRQSVVDSFVAWSTPFEGLLLYPYTDAEGLVTTGMGNLLDALASGQQLHVNCGHGTHTPAGQASATDAARNLTWSGGDIESDWEAIKAAWPGISSTGCAKITKCRLEPGSVQNLISGKMKGNEAYIMSHMPSFAKAPADAQMAVHSMAWAMGPGFSGTWTQFRNAFDAGNYAECAAQSHMKGVGIDMRNLANELLFTVAGTSKAKANPDHLYYLDGLSLIGGGGGGFPWLGTLTTAGLIVLGWVIYRRFST